jgi:hypothetical protein
MKLSSTLVAFFLLVATPVASEDIDFPEYQVYEIDDARFAPNDTKPTLYDIKCVGKEGALWIEGQDYNYQWLTIVPYDGIRKVILNRSRGNPFVKDKGSWIGKQLAKAGDVRGWFTISYTDSKGRDRQVILLAPVGGARALAELLASRRVELEETGENDVAEPDPAVPTPPVTLSAPVVSPSVPQSVPPPAIAPVDPKKLIDVMTVSEFRAAGLGKLTDAELDALDAWINRLVSARK